MTEAERSKACGEEINAALKKYEFTLVYRQIMQNGRQISGDVVLVSTQEEEKK